MTLEQFSTNFSDAHPTYNVNEIDKDTVWLFQYTPKARVRGGGFEITIAKKTGEVVKVEHYQ